MSIRLVATNTDGMSIEADWLEQFVDGDRIVAGDLLESLTLVSEATFENEIRRLLDSIETGPLALYAVRSLDYEKKNNVHYLGALGDRNHKPLAIAPGSEVGSEGRVAHITARLAGGSAGHYLDHPTIAEMTKATCTRLVLIDDLIGSGNRAIDFIEHLYHHPTTASWHSYGKIRFILVAYAGTALGLSAVGQLKKPPVGICVAHGCPTLRDNDSSKYREMRAVCRKYVKKTAWKSKPLGYGRIGTTMVFAHGCPNTAPSILWAERPQRWQALFPNRLIPTELLERFIAVPATRVENQDRDQWEFALWRTRPRVLALFLREAGRRRKRSVEPIFRISIVTGLSVEQCSSLRRQCIANGLLDVDWELTSAGALVLSELRDEIKSQPVKRQEMGPYFPRSLRPRPPLANALGSTEIGS